MAGKPFLSTQEIKTSTLDTSNDHVMDWDNHSTGT